MPRKPAYDRDELIDRARDLFWKQGWAGTSLKDLERVLGLKPGSFYAAFGSKDALFELALERYAEDGQARLRKLVEAHGPLDALRAFVHSVISRRDAPAKACMLAKSVLELSSSDHALAGAANRHLAAMESSFADMFESAQSRGEISTSQDAKILARRFQSDLMGLRMSAERSGVDATAIAHEICEDLGRL